MAFGVLALVAPRVMVSAMSRSATPQGAEAAFTRMWGSRDLALGLGTVVAVDHGAPVRGWIEGAALADAADALTALLERKRLSPNGFRGTLAIAGASAIFHGFLSRRLDPAPPAQPGQPEAVATGHHEPAGA